MKKYSLFFLSLVCAPLAFAFVNPEEIQETCIENYSVINQEPHVSAALETFGGFEKLSGTWKLSGLAGNFAKVQVSLFQENNRFYVQSQKDEAKEIWLCVHQDQPDTLLIRVLHPAKPENSLFKLKAAAKENMLSIAATGSKWKFMGFKKI